MRVVRRTICVAALVLATPASAHPVPFYWPLPKTLRMIDGKRIQVGGRAVRIRSDTALCSGVGPRKRKAGKLRWKHFDCTYTTKGGLGRDVEFRLHVLGKLRFRITDAHWIA
jgi:hypothetical protein